MKVRVALVVALIAFASPAFAQEAETETARLLHQGAVKGGVSFEYQTSSDGTEAAIPAFVEGGLHDRLELVVEPVAYTAIRPKAGANATGPGDLEVTLVGLALAERPSFPAIALAGEVKIPTARDHLIGTRKTDVAGYLILSKRFGNLDLHVNGSFTYVGKPAGVTVSNVWGFAVLGRYYIGKLDLFAEVLGNTAATPESETMGGAAELTGSELVGTLGGGYWVTSWMQLYCGVSLDNNAAVLIQPGITLFHNL